MIKLVAFDWNGTLLADTVAILDSVNAVLRFAKLKPISLKTFQKHFDVPVIKAFAGLGIPQKFLATGTEEITRTFHSTYEPRAAKVRTRAFAKQLLHWLSKQSIKSIIFSNHIGEPIRKQLERLKIERYFAQVLANSQKDTALKIRAKLERLKNYIKDNNFSADEILIVGDTVEEVEIGRELGATTVAVTDGNCSIVRLKNARPNYLISSLKEVTEIVRQINNQTIYDR